MRKGLAVRAGETGLNLNVAKMAHYSVSAIVEAQRLG